MNLSRFPRICFESLRELALKNPSYRFNWFKQVGINFGLGNSYDDWSVLELGSIESKRVSLLERYGRSLLSFDTERCSNSKSLLIYPNLSRVEGTQRYLLSRLPLPFKRIFAQIRMLNFYVCRINTGRVTYRFDADSDCLCCRQGKDNLVHILAECPSCVHLCKSAVPEIFSGMDALDNILNILSCEDNYLIKKFVNLVKSILLERLHFKASLN